MKLESRYIVIKQSDAAKYLGGSSIKAINDSLSHISESREADGKIGYPNYIVLEEDWPEYHIAKEALEGRIAINEMNNRKEFNRGASAAAQHHKEHKSSSCLRGVGPFCEGWNSYMKTTGEV